MAWWQDVVLCCCIVFGTFATVNALDPHAPPTTGMLTRYSFEEPHMGTLFRIVLYAPNEAIAKKAARAAFERIAELNHIMSDYQDDSELMQLCKKTGGDPVPVSADLFDILQLSESISKETDGALDVTIGPLSRIWRRARRTREMPKDADLRKALDLVGFRKLRLDPKNRTVQLLVAGMLLDLGAIAKGYAADAALAVLRRFGITRALVAAGGDVSVGEAPPDVKGWKVGVAPLKNPNDPPTRFLLLTNAGVSTAGDAEQYVEIAGKRYSHILDPKTGLGLNGRRSVTVIAPSCTLSDGWDTAFCVLGPEKTLAMIEAKQGFACIYTQETEKGIVEHISKRFVGYEIPAKK